MAISNQRIQTFEYGKVTFGYKYYKSGAKQKSITLEEDEFIRRFLQYILPCGFYKIRYFGIVAICNIKSKLIQSIRLIGKAVYFPVLEGLTAADIIPIWLYTIPIVRSGDLDQPCFYTQA